jgi:hypothetical protein
VSASAFFLWYQPQVKFRSPLAACLIILESNTTGGIYLKEERREIEAYHGWIGYGNAK